MNYIRRFFILGSLVLLSTYITISYAEIDQEVVEGLEIECIENVSQIVFKEDGTFKAVQMLELQDRVYLDLSQFLEVLNVKIEKDGQVYRVVSSKAMDEQSLPQTGEQPLYIGEYNTDGSYKSGQIFFDNGKYYNGTFSNNIPSGKGEMLFPDSKIYIGEFEQGYPHGTGQYIYTDGSNYIGEVRYGTITGYGRIRYENKDVYRGYFYLGLFHGAGTLSEYDGGTKQGLWDYGAYIKYLSEDEMELYYFDK